MDGQRPEAIVDATGSGLLAVSNPDSADAWTSAAWFARLQGWTPADQTTG